MEAMAKGLPVAASAVSGVPEGLGDTGKLLASPLYDSRTTIQELVAGLQMWAEDAALRQQIGQTCRQRAQQMFREERMIGETIAVVQNVLHNSLNLKQEP